VWGGYKLHPPQEGWYESSESIGINKRQMEKAKCQVDLLVGAHEIPYLAYYWMNMRSGNPTTFIHVVDDYILIHG